MSLATTVHSLKCEAPDGKVDVPFCYLYDATSLTDGQDYLNQAVTVDSDSDFLIRRIVGLNLCTNSNATGGLVVRYRGQNAMMQNKLRAGLYPTYTNGLLTGSVANGNWPVLPEALFTPSSQISFDLFGVLRDSVGAGANTVYNSYLGFWGVRRFDAGSVYQHKTKYAWRPLPYTYTYDLDMNWSHWTDAVNGIAEAPRKFYVEILERDFQLCAIGVTNIDGSPVTTNDFQLSMFDAARTLRYSNMPVNLPFFNYNGPKQYGVPVFPTPPIVFPTKGLMQFEITSMLPFGSTGQYKLHFMGIWRETQ